MQAFTRTFFGQFSFILNAFALVVIATPFSTYAQSIESTERAALIDFYNSAGGNGWVYQGNHPGSVPWDVNNPDSNHCTWIGVGCEYQTIDVDGESVTYSEVTELALGLYSILNTEGEITESLGDLINLTTLRITADQNLTGSITNIIGNLVNAERIHITAQGLNVDIPAEIVNLPNLRELRLTGQSMNPIPSELGNVTSLELLSLTGFSGSIPTSIGNLTNLRLLGLLDGGLSGSIPSALGDLSNLETLVLHNNNLQGGIPLELGLLTGLSTLNLSGNNLSGSIPSTIGNLTTLDRLDLSDNDLTGPIPPSLGSLANITSMDLHNNNLSGVVPEELGNLSNIQTLSLGGNILNGEIPTQLGNLTNARTINLAYNQLFGEIPDSIFTLLDQAAVDGRSFPVNFLGNEFLGTTLTASHLEQYPEFTESYLEESNSIPYLGNLSCIEVSERTLSLLGDANDSWFRVACSSDAFSCIPASHGPSSFVGNPIGIVNGVKTLLETDYKSPDNSALVFSRKYDSSSKQWEFSYSPFLSSLKMLPNWIYTDVLIKRPNGKVLVYQCQGTGNGECTRQTLEGDLIANDHVLESYSDHFLYTDRVTGITERFDMDGNLVFISDPSQGIISYTINGDIITVSDSYGHQIAYTVDGGRVVSADTPIGQFNYSYRTDGLLSIVTRPDATTMEYLYDEPGYSESSTTGLLTGVVDSNTERLSSWYYDSRGRAYMSEHASGLDMDEIIYVSEANEQQYDDLAQQYVTLQKVRDHIKPGGSRVRYTYLNPEGVKVQSIEFFDSNGVLTKSEHYTYGTPSSSYGYLAEFTNVENITTQYIRDTYGRITTETENVGSDNERVTTFDYDDDGAISYDLLRITTPELETVFSYERVDGKKLISSKTLTDLTIQSPLNIRTTYAYDANGLLRSIDGPRTDVQDVTMFDYNNVGRLVQVTNAAGHIQTINSYNANGKPTSITGFNGVNKTIGYDSMGRVSGYHRAGLSASFDYDDNGLVVGSTLSNGISLTYEYDAAHRLTAIEDESGNRVEYELDNAGNKTRVSIRDHSGIIRRTNQLLYDEFDQIEQLIDGEENPSYKTYYPTGLAESDIDALGNEKQYTYNALAQLELIIDEGEAVTTLDYDSAGNVNSVLDDDGVGTSYTYDGLGNLIRRESPNTGVTIYRYDEANNLVQKISTSGNQIRDQYFDYDELNRLISKTGPYGLTDIIYSYDSTVNGNYGVGKLTRVVEDDAQTELFYDVNGELEAIVRNIEFGSGPLLTLQYHYDANSNLIGMTYPGGRRVDYALNNLNQITSITTTKDQITTVLVSNIQYLPFGPFSSFSYGNGLNKTLDYDQNYQIASTETGDIENLRFDYSPRNNISEITDLINGNNSQSFDYNEVGSLMNASGNYGLLTYKYSGVFDRIESNENGQLSDYLYSSGTHLLTSVLGNNSKGFSYNGFGDLIEVGSLTLNYNDFGQLDEVYDPATNSIAAFTYNYLNQRSHKESNLTSNSDYYYLYDKGGNLISEVRADGTIIGEYIYLNGYPIAAWINESNPVQSQQLTRRVSAGRDDAEESENGVVRRGAANLRMVERSGNAGVVGIHFRDISIPKGATITDAYIQFTARRGNSADASLYIRAEDIGDSPRISTSDFDITDRQLTSTGVPWEPGAWIRNNRTEEERTPDISGVIQEVIERSDWESGNEITFSFSGDGLRRAYSYNSDPTLAAELVVSFSFQQNSTTGGIYYFHTDHLGTVTRLTDDSQTVVWQADYDPFGKATINIETVTNNFRFPGQYYDEETGLHYNYYRYYDPSTGRYITSDPIGLAGGLNTYAYVGGNPVNRVDPLGLDWEYDTSSGTYTENNADGNPTGTWPGVTGPHGNGALPPGDYSLPSGPVPVAPGWPSRSSYCDGAGNCWWQPITPNFPTNRNGLGIHPDGNQPGTAGCIGITNNDTTDLYDALNNSNDPFLVVY